MTLSGTGAPAGQAASGAQPQAGTTSTGQAPAAAQGQAPAAGEGSGTGSQPPAGAQGATTGESAEDRATRLEAEATEARKEAASYRTRLRTLEAEQQKAAQAGMSEAERTAAQLQAALAHSAELEGRLRAQSVEASASAAAAKLNYRNPELAIRLVDTAALEFDDSGRPKNVEKLLRELAQREPYLVKGAGTDFGGGQQGAAASGEPDMNTLLRAAFRG